MALKDIAKLVAKANKEKTPAQEFLYQLNKAIELDTTGDEYQGGVYRGSSIGSCLRMQYYMSEDYPRDKGSGTRDASMVGIAESGTDAHERIQNHIIKMKENGFDVEWIDVEDYLKRRPQLGTRIVRKEGNETRLANDILNLYSKCDGIIKFQNQYYILEIKTETSFKHRGRVEPTIKHKQQSSTYSLLLGIKQVMFVYINRDVYNKKAFVQEVTDEMRMSVVYEIEEIETFKTLKMLPPMVYDHPKGCTYCDFKQQCKKDGPTEHYDKPVKEEPNNGQG